MTTSSTHAAFTGSIPENYDTYLGPLLFEFSAADMARRVASAVAGPARILEVACGTGISTRHLANALPAGSSVLATDLNQAMLDHAAKVNGTLPGVDYAQADALDLAFEDDRFDAVVCQFGIMFFPDKAKGLGEMQRVVKPGGTVALNVWDSFAHNPAVEIVDESIKSFFTSDPPRFLEVPWGYYDIEQTRQMFHDAGLAHVNVATVQEHVAVTDFRNAARGLITGNPTILEVEQRATVAVDDILEAAAAALADAFGQPPVKLPFQEIVYVANKPRD